LLIDSLDRNKPRKQDELQPVRAGPQLWHVALETTPDLPQWACAALPVIVSLEKQPIA
jgi:hypothetical protein